MRRHRQKRYCKQFISHISSWRHADFISILPGIPESPKFCTISNRKDTLPTPTEQALTRWGTRIVFAYQKLVIVQPFVDYPKQKAVTKLNVYRISRIKQCIYLIEEVEVFSWLNSKSGYWRVNIDNPCWGETGSTLQHVPYRFNRMPLPLRHAPGWCQWTMDVADASVREKFVLVYFDAIFAFSRSTGKHSNHVSQVTMLSLDAGAPLRFQKWKFLIKSVDYFGPVICTRSFKIFSHTTDAAKGRRAWRISTTVKLSFVLCNVCRPFLTSVSSIQSLLKYKIENFLPFDFVINKDQLDSMKSLPLESVSSTVFTLSYAEGRMALDSNSWDGSLEYVLLEKGPAKIPSAIGYCSRFHTSAKRVYDTTQRLSLAIVWEMLLLLPSLEDTSFTVCTYLVRHSGIVNVPDATKRLAE